MTSGILPPSARVMISISEPDSEDLMSRGLDELHLRHVFIEIIRHILAAGHSISYGGDLRRGGYTETIIDLLRTYRRQDLDARERFSSYISWPVQDALDADALAELRTFSTPVLMPRPENVPANEVGSPDPGTTLAMARGYTEMRERLVEDSDCVVILGGRTHGQAGMIPGVQEEAYLALHESKPMFIVGGYGGSAAAICAALSGRANSMFSTDYHSENTASYASRLEEARRGEDYLTPETLGEFLREKGWVGNPNQLTMEENERLVVSDDVDEIVALLLRAIRQLPGA
ncbi:MAG: hypothetical protein HOF43_08070 [Chloroflexi bacterium]|nr:hypothetical protein [Chloroflexota bacterium]